MRAYRILFAFHCGAAVALGDRGGVMKRLLLLVGVVALLVVTAPNRSMAADALGAWTNGLPTAWVEGPACDPWVDYNCTPSKAATAMALKAGAASGFCDPYLNYKCLDQYLGDDVFTRFFAIISSNGVRGWRRRTRMPRRPAAPTLRGLRLPSRRRRCRSPNGPTAARRISPRPLQT